MIRELYRGIKTWWETDSILPTLATGGFFTGLIHEAARPPYANVTQVETGSNQWTQGQPYLAAYMFMFSWLADYQPSATGVPDPMEHVDRLAERIIDRFDDEAFAGALGPLHIAAIEREAEPILNESETEEDGNVWLGSVGYLIVVNRNKGENYQA